LTRIKDPHRTIEIACFLRLTMLRLTDASLTCELACNNDPLMGVFRVQSRPL